MNDDAIQLGRIRRFAEGFEGCLERWIGHKQEAVWQMLTESPQLVQWLAPGSIELREGGRVHIDFGDSGVVIDSTVLAFDPPRLIAYSWSGDGAHQPRLAQDTQHVRPRPCPGARDRGCDREWQ